MDTSISFWLIQALGFLAFGLTNSAYQFKRQKVMFAIIVAADMCWCLHFFLLQAYLPALTIFIAVMRTFFVVFVFPRRRILLITAAAILIFVLTFIYSDNEIKNWLPCMAVIIYSLSVYFHENYTISRACIGVCAILWIIIGIAFNSYAEIVSSSVALVSLVTGYIRHRKELMRSHDP